ncbi:MAG: Na/Pi cotransporter family protein [Prevotellaceae bacterium]|nr:Na/Pi cotransporter family protein [Prevotellaceae bacterium]MDY2633238.1 Na/Pi cotransporter family protein [Prevotella sp.]
MSITIILKLIGALALLIYGMKVMSEALQKMAGPQLRHILGAMTTNRFTGVLTGMLITVAVQSSSATTVMTVSFVNAGLLTLAQSISVIMGSNIGTTLTAWIMSAGFSLNITDFVWPAFLIGIMLIYSKRHRYLGDFLYGVAFMFFSLGVLSQTGKEMDLGHNQDLIDFFASFNPDSYLTIIIFLVIGTLLTCIVQSSAALMAITMVLCTSGVLPIYQGVALVMGENIGTTLTANLAALTGNTQARRAAMAHLVFNIFGVMWILCVLYPFVNICCNVVGFDPTSTKHPDPVHLSFALAAFHTAFNITNTAILIWFIPQIERVVCWIVKPGKNDEDEEFRLRYIQGGIMETPELSVLEAQKEISLFTDRIQRMYGMVRELLVERDETRFAKAYARIEKYEGISDNMEIEIAKYLEKVSDAHLSDETKAKIRAMLREISEIESIGDSCYNIARIISRKETGKEDFTEQQYDCIKQMMELADEALSQMAMMLKGRKENIDVTRSFNIENEINRYRNQLKSQNITNVNEHRYTYTIGTYFMDIINECEKLADYVLNVVEARVGSKKPD